MNRQRKFMNIRLTSRFHVRHMGLWMCISVALVVLFNVMLYQVLIQQWGFVGGDDFGGGDGGSFQRIALIAIIAETVMFSAALIILAQSTSHRIAGAFLALQKTCDRVSAGERNVRQKFRAYDGLDDLERSFNRMLDSLTGGGQPPKP